MQAVILSRVLCSSKCSFASNRNVTGIMTLATNGLARNFSRGSLLSSRLQFANGFPCLLRTSPNTSLRRSFSSTEFCSPKMREKLRLRDGMPTSYDLIYRSDFAKYLVVAQIGTFVAITMLTVQIAWLLMSAKETEAEKEERERQVKEALEEKRRKEKETTIGKFVEELNKEKGQMDVLLTKGLDPLEPGSTNIEDFFLFGGSLVLFAGALMRVLRILPVRIYVNKKNHCVGVYHGHLIPGKLTHHEFVAGTVRKVEAKTNLEIYTKDCLFVDGSGKKFIMLEHFFRHPADYNKILGIQEEFREEELRERQRNVGRE